MAVDNKFERCADDDPNRCQAIADQGQCPYKALPGCTNCAMHGGTGQQRRNQKNALHSYRLQQYQERVGDFANNTEIKDLRAEIGIMRMTLETLLISCKEANKLIMFSDKITGMVNQITKLIEATQRLEERNNNLLDRKVVIVIADSIVAEIAKYITDPDTLIEIGSKLCESIEAAASPTNSIRVTAEVNNGS